MYVACIFASQFCFLCGVDASVLGIILSTLAKLLFFSFMPQTLFSLKLFCLSWCDPCWSRLHLSAPFYTVAFYKWINSVGGFLFQTETPMHLFRLLYIYNDGLCKVDFGYTISLHRISDVRGVNAVPMLMTFCQKPARKYDFVKRHTGDGK